MTQLTLKQCYDSVGLVRHNDVPCDPNAEVSACCGTGGSQCIDNLHCVNPKGGSVPGTCTFQSWVSGTEPGCPCPPIYVGNGTALDYRDSVTLCPDGGFVCGANNFDSCYRGESMAIINYGLAGDKIPATSSLHHPTAALSTYYAGLALSTQSVSRATASGTSTSASATSTNTNAPASLIPSASSSSSDGLSTGAKAGIGAGAAGIVVLLIAAIAFFLIRRKRKQRLNEEAAAVPAAQPYYDYNQHRQPSPQPPGQHYEKYAEPARPWQPPAELDTSNAGEIGRQRYR